MKNKLTEEEKKEKIRQYKKLEYEKNKELIKKKQRDYYYKKKIEQGLPLKKDKYKITLVFYKDAVTEEEKNKFILHFD
jgi:hypothetical protein